PNRPANAPAKLVLAVFRLYASDRIAGLRPIEIILGIKLVVSQKFIERSVEIIGSRLRDDVDHGTRRAAGIGTVDVRLYVDLLNRVDRGPNTDRPDESFVVVHSVDFLVVVVSGLAVRGKGRRLTTVVRPSAAHNVALRPFLAPGSGSQQFDKIAAIERKVFDLVRLKRCADSGGVRVQQRYSRCRYLNGCARLTNVQLGIDAQGRARRQGQPRNKEAIEPDSRNGYRIGSNLQKRKRIVAGRVRLRGSRNARARVRRCYRCVGYYGARGISYRAHNRSG